MGQPIKPGDQVVIKRSKREVLQVVFNILILIFAGIGTVLIGKNTELNAALTGSGLENLKFFTVQSNLFCGIVAAAWLFCHFLSKKMPVALKLMAASAVGLTFLIIAGFLAPMYPELNMYEGGNLYFHLIVPLLAMAECILMETRKKIPFRYTLFSAAISFVYGGVYLMNNIINGIGEWPKSNDWYGFLNWGYPVGILIYACVVLANWGIALLLRFLNHLIGKLFEKKKNTV